jgi:hypothetical protein
MESVTCIRIGRRGYPAAFRGDLGGGQRDRAEVLVGIHPLAVDDPLVRHDVVDHSLVAHSARQGPPTKPLASGTLRARHPCPVPVQP